MASVSVRRPTDPQPGRFVVEDRGDDRPAVGAPSPSSPTTAHVAGAAPAAAPVAPAAVVASKAHPPQEEDDDATTAYSSWHEDGSSSQLSSPLCLACRSGHEVDDDDDDDDDSQLSCPRTVVSQSSDPGDDEADGDGERWSLPRRPSQPPSCYTDQPDGSARSGSLPSVVIAQRADRSRLHSSEGSEELSELMERARHMLRRERSDEYAVGDYLGSEAGSLSSSSSSESPGRYSPIDAACRSKMMEWSFRVLEHGFPLDPASSRRNEPAKRWHGPRRKHSVQAIQVVSQAFGMVDRLAWRHLIENDRCVMDRSRYKLACMTCLHVAAKTCGLFGLHDGEECYKKMDSDHCKGSEPAQREDAGEDDDSHCYYLRGESASSLSLSTAADEDLASECDCGQTILSTPSRTDSHCRREVSDDVQPNDISIDTNSETSFCQGRRHLDRKDEVTRRPPLSILSLAGLAALCQDEYSIGDLSRGELDVLKTLDWRLGGATAVDWVYLLLDLLAACARGIGGTTRRGAVLGVEATRERALACVERAVEANLRAAPSLVGQAAVAHALDGRDEAMRRAVSLYREVASDMSPHADEEVIGVRLRFLG